MCRLFAWVFGAAYLLAGIVYSIGLWGLFDAERDPLSGVYLILLGFPWTRLIDAAPEPAWPWLAVLAPAINLVLLAAICRLTKRRRR